MSKARDGYVRRIAFEITEKQQRELDIYLSAHGTKKAVYSALTNSLIKLFRAGHVDKVLGAVYAGAIGAAELLGIADEIKDNESEEAAGSVEQVEES